jgi:hypothetical protein
LKSQDAFAKTLSGGYKVVDFNRKINLSADLNTSTIIITNAVSTY